MAILSKAYSIMFSYLIFIIVKCFPGDSVKNTPAMQETQVQSLSQEDLLERKVATHFSILAREIPGTEEPGGLYMSGTT